MDMFDCMKLHASSNKTDIMEHMNVNAINADWAKDERDICNMYCHN